ncbi:hypothetical protein VTJ49DRAFT_1993 [Mycothermus thermophilus]|uniref:Checkpoint protein RAD24-like helical bundle domain-containing protein n=1 Tax=Humicola insolens TaxID=85995 RepID=A0ABR3VB08_HUMIN
MAPPAKRRKRAIVDDDSDDDDSQKTNNGSQNFLKRFLSSPSKNSPSPEKKPSITTAQPASASPSPSPIRKRATRATSSKSVRSPSTSPLKPRTRASAAAKDAKDAAGSADLRTLFSRQAQRNSQSQSAASSASSLSLATGASASGSYHLSAGGGRRSQLDEIISDPISEQNGDDDDEDDVPLMYSASTAAASSLAERARAAQKRFGNNKTGNGASSRGDGGSTGIAAAGGQRFLRTKQATPSSQTPSSTGPTPLPNEDSRPWSERFAPTSLDELAVHKRKVADVRHWLEEVFTGRARQRLLVLKGPAGAGKTTTVRLLARDMRCEVLEWRNPGNSFGVPGQVYQSAAAQFEEFLGRGGKFGQLDIEEEDGGTPPPQTQVMGPPPPAASGKRLMLVEEFPNTFMRSSAGLMGFRDAVIQFLSASVPPMGFGYASEPATPIVMVISETLLTTTSASADSFTAHRLLGPEILKHPGTTVIEFKPIAPTFLTKALELVVQKEARKSGRRRTPGPRVLQRLGEVGDIRNAISSLEFLCAKGDTEADWGGKVAFTKPKRASKDAAPALTKGEQESLELVSQREATLGIFHAVGKVVYNKRGDFPPGSAEAAAEAALPDYMSHLARRKKSEVVVDALIDEIGTDTHTFISALHENYPLSCEQTGPSDPNSPIDYINGCLDYLSDSDLLYPSWDIFFGGGRGTHAYGGAVSLGGYSGKDSGSHMLRQDEMAFQVAVRGMLFSLPSPVRRQAHPNGRGGDAYKMFYPTYLKLWRSKEELGALVDLWAAKLLKGEDCGPGPPAHPQTKQSFVTNGAAAFRKPTTTPGKINGFTTTTTHPSAGGIKPSTASQKPSRGPPPPLPLLSLGSAARKELLLERLPYTAHMARGRRQCSFFGGAMRMRDLDQMVAFRGIGALGAGEDDVSEDGTETQAGGVVGGVQGEIVAGCLPGKADRGTLSCAGSAQMHAASARECSAARPSPCLGSLSSFSDQSRAGTEGKPTSKSSPGTLPQPLRSFK